MFRFTIRDVLWLMVVVGVALGWIVNRWQLIKEGKRRDNLWSVQLAQRPPPFLTPANHIPIVAPGWQIYGHTLDQFLIEIDDETHHSGRTSASIKSMVAVPRSSGMIAQAIKADDYRGKRVRLSGYVRTQDAMDVAWLYLKAEDPTSYAIDKSPRIMGTTEWTKHEIVLDIPNNAAHIAFGAGLQGAGQIWVDDFQIEIVSQNISLSARAFYAGYAGPQELSSTAVQTEPFNLDFEK